MSKNVTKSARATAAARKDGRLRPGASVQDEMAAPTGDKFKVIWVDHGREPQCDPNPSFLAGRDLDVSKGAERACVLELPYPARRCGVFVVECKKCKLVVGFTTMGRPDDPRRVKFACRALLN